ncbi:hypothetical protein CNECB9_470002 [Cupriavidus necator]|uniref:Acetoacetyl-CoA reductase n=1 Tax=Cupriavidus necator TaxID=106590 RepID=A0A1K0JU17_CUPNE|nr:hypothetical protein CNECB9_470002 [Cupriavidus necator]
MHAERAPSRLAAALEPGVIEWKSLPFDHPPVSPGYIATKMVTAVPQEVLDTKIIPQIPVGRLGKPEEVAALIAYLCSEEAAFVTGANIAINGGQHMQ